MAVMEMVAPLPTLIPSLPPGASRLSILTTTLTRDKNHQLTPFHYQHYPECGYMWFSTNLRETNGIRSA